jgi:hypothetical protein
MEVANRAQKLQSKWKNPTTDWLFKQTLGEPLDVGVIVHEPTIKKRNRNPPTTHWEGHCTSLLQIHKWPINTATTSESGLQNSNQCSHVDIYMATPSNPLANRYTITMSKLARREKWSVLVLAKEESNEAWRPTRWRTKPLPKCQCLKIAGEP